MRGANNGMDLQRGACGGLRELALFAGAGGGILAGQLCGDHTVCAVEWDAYAAGVLVRQQNAGHLPPFPVWDDVRTFDGRPWRGVADCVSGGFPCQDISVAGGGDGIDGERSGLWREFARVVREVGPEWVRVENSPALTSRGLGVVLGPWPRSGLMRGGMCFPLPTAAPRIFVSESGSSPGAVFPTPAARDFRHPNAKSYEERGGGKKGEQLPNFVGGPLNPTFVEWLMGWPMGWTAAPAPTGSAASGTDKYHEWRRQHGFCWPRI